jgi:FixJ family two-component response regulator
MGRSVGSESAVTEVKQQKVAIVDDNYAVRDSLQVLLEVMAIPSRHSHQQKIF